MILLEAKHLYYNTQVYFRKHHFDDMPNDQRVWAKRYTQWLLHQGCVIVRHSDTKLLRNSLGVAPYFDKFGFEEEKDAMWFLLRWS